MEISDVRVKMIRDSGDRLKAVCTVTFDSEFVVRDVKVVEGTNGLFVAMPSRKLSVHCSKCRHKNHLRSRFCNDCGAKLPPTGPTVESDGRTRMHRDIAHPITTAFRELLQTQVIEAFHLERENSKSPDYEPPDLEEETEEEEEEELETVTVEGEEEQDDTDRGPLTEYDEIIAGLRSGIREPRERPETGRGRPRERDRGRDTTPARSSDAPRPERSERSERPERRERTGVDSGNRGRSRPAGPPPPRRDRSAPERRPVERSVERMAERPVERPVDRPVVRPTREYRESRVDDRFDVGMVEDRADTVEIPTHVPAEPRTESARPEPVKKVEPPAPRPSSKPSDDDLGFGAGIL